MEELFPIIISRRSLPFTWSWDLEEVCKFSSRLLLVKPSLLRSSHPIPSKMSKLKFKTRRVFPQTSRDWSSLESSSRMAELCLTTTSRRSQLCIWCWDWEEVCRSSWRPWLARPSPWRLSQVTPLRMSRLRSKTRRESHQTSRDWSSPESS